MPTRYLKPGICDSERIERCRPIAETLYYRLLVNVDDFGRLDARPALIRARCFPLKDERTITFIETLLRELDSADLILLYESNACKYLQMQRWDNVPRAKESKFPGPSDEDIRLHASVCNPHANLPLTGTGTGTVNRKPELKQKQKPKKTIVSARDVLTEFGITDDQLATDFIKLRDKKKAAVTSTAMAGIRSQAAKAGIALDAALRICCERGWAGFQAKWMLDKPNGNGRDLEAEKTRLYRRRSCYRRGKPPC